MAVMAATAAASISWRTLPSTHWLIFASPGNSRRKLARVVPGEVLKVRIDGVEHAFDGRVRWVSADSSFTPYFALTEHDRSRLSYLAEVDLEGVEDLPSGLPLEVDFP